MSTNVKVSKHIEDGVYGPSSIDVFAENGCYVSPDDIEYIDSHRVFDDNQDDIEYDIEDYRDRVTDRLMNCDCEEQVEVVDSYIMIDEDSGDPMLNTIFMCAGCGNQVRVEATVCDVYDIDINGTKRE